MTPFKRLVIYIGIIAFIAMFVNWGNCTGMFKDEDSVCWIQSKIEPQ